ncbi:ligand-binding protein SH3 [Oceanobacillus picturae]|uniref:Ligand-binding protein SH3 n=1 Tax=Oceanobacillus picturae TaxID=171693 RepID=W9AQ03_9BACI|nr:hypothetical protein [Oceanobacillus picturae]GAQ18190.1 ligand-binding protein SH3 [Oceanobacillus picturae]CDO04696.1 hypothetical protein BN988_03261 [Oceanobacillus picturae]
MNKSEGYRKFQIGFHLIIALIASVIVYAYAVNDFQAAYVIIGSVIAISSIYQLVLLLSQKNNQTKNHIHKYL